MADEIEIQTEPTPEPEPSTARSMAGSIVGPVARGLSTALMQGAFESFGQAFTRTGNVRRDTMNEAGRMEPWRQAGQKTAGALEMRWHTMEYENFQASAIEPYIAAKKDMLAQYKQLHSDLDSGVWLDPNGEPEQIDVSTPGGREKLTRLRGQLEKDFYGRNSDMDIDLFNSAHKYPTNPMISQRIQMISQAYSDRLLTATNPAQTLQAEGAQSEITARMMTAETNQLAARTAAAGAKALKEPTNLRQVKKHPEIGGGGAMQWLTDSQEGAAIMYGNQGADAYRKALSAFEQKLIKDDPKLKQQPDKLRGLLEGLEGKVRNLAASLYLKRNDPEMWEESRKSTPWYFDFEKEGDPSDGQLKETDERGYKGERRMSVERKKELFEGWTEYWNKELDNWASNPANPPDPGEAMEHMEQWIKDAVINGASGIPRHLTIAVNDATKELRAELISALIERGGRTVMRNKFIAEAHPIQALFSGIGGTGRPGGRRGRFLRAQDIKRRQGLLEEGE